MIFHIGLRSLAEPDGVAKEAVKPVLIFWVAVCLTYFGITEKIL